MPHVPHRTRQTGAPIHRRHHEEARQRHACWAIRGRSPSGMPMIGSSLGGPTIAREHGHSNAAVTAAHVRRGWRDGDAQWRQAPPPPRRASVGGRTGPTVRIAAPGQGRGQTAPPVSQGQTTKGKALAIYLGRRLTKIKHGPLRSET